MFDDEYCSECECKSCEEARERLKIKFKYTPKKYSETLTINIEDTSVRMPN